LHGAIMKMARRSLQRDLKGMMGKELLAVEGATNQLVYRLKPDARG